MNPPHIVLKLILLHNMKKPINICAGHGDGFIVPVRGDSFSTILVVRNIKSIVQFSKIHTSNKSNKKILRGNNECTNIVYPKECITIVIVNQEYITAPIIHLPYRIRPMTLFDMPVILANCRIDTPGVFFNFKRIAFLVPLSICCKKLLLGMPNIFMRLLISSSDNTT